MAFAKTLSEQMYPLLVVIYQLLSLILRQIIGRVEFLRLELDALLLGPHSLARFTLPQIITLKPIDLIQFCP